jgi:5-(carboxyamino)imidazole ribonucleotide mutase
VLFRSGAANAALFAVAMLAAHDAALAKQLDAYRAEQTRAARAQDLPVTGLADGLAGL